MYNFLIHKSQFMTATPKITHVIENGARQNFQRRIFDVFFARNRSVDKNIAEAQTFLKLEKDKFPENKLKAQEPYSQTAAR